MAPAAPSAAEYVGFGAVGNDGTKNTALTAALDGPSTSLTTYNVTNSDGNASGTGSWRDAWSADDRHIILQTDVDFGSTTAGDMTYANRDNVFCDGNGYDITRGNTTTEGNSSWSMTGCTNIVWYNMRIDMGYRTSTFADANERGDCLSVTGNNRRLMFRRCTFRGSDDGGMDIVGFDNNDSLPSPYTNMDITLQQCFFLDNRKSMLVKYGPHGHLTFFQNIFARSWERNPQIRGTIDSLDFVNNIVWGWGHGAFGYGIRDYVQESGSSPGGNPPADTDQREGGTNTTNYNLVSNRFMESSDTVSAYNVLGWSLSDGANNNLDPDGTTRGTVYVDDNTFNTSPTYLADIGTSLTEISIPSASQVTPVTASTLPATLLVDGSAGAVGPITLDSDEQSAIDDMRADFGL